MAMSSLYLDIETTSIDHAAAFVETPTAPANYKDAAKIDAYVIEAKARAIERCALDFGLLRIGAIGLGAWTAGGEVETHTTCCATEAEEAAALRHLWTRIEATFLSGGVVVGYNLAEFDMPAIITRSWLLGVSPGFATVRKYDDPHVLDLMQITSFGRIERAKKLSWWATRLGWAHDDTLTGAQMPALIQAGEWDAVRRHVEADVALTMHLHRLLMPGVGGAYVRRS
jgi:hypothetical protein